jgi:hypothetical protein
MVERVDDEDYRYEVWRDKGSEDLEMALKRLVLDFVEKKNHYYSNSRERILEHSIAILGFELEDIKKQRGNKL